MNNNFNNKNHNNENLIGKNFQEKNDEQKNIFVHHDNNVASYPIENFQYEQKHDNKLNQENSFYLKNNTQNKNNNEFNESGLNHTNNDVLKNDYSRFSYNVSTNGIHNLDKSQVSLANNEQLEHTEINGMIGIDYYGDIPNEKRYDMCLYTLSELNEMGIGVENTTKKFCMGKMYYKLTDEYLNNFYNQQNNLNDAQEDFNVDFESQESFDEIPLNDDTENKYFENENLNDFSESDNDFIEKQNLNKESVENKNEELNLENMDDPEIDNSVYINNDEANGTIEVDGNIPESDNLNLENLINDHTELLLNQDKNLDSDLEYKIYSLTFNKEEFRKDLGKLDNVTFDIYPKDRIMVLSSDESKSSTTLIDVLSRRYEKNSGYVYFNIKRKQKWIDMYSKEFQHYDLDMVNKKNDVLYQLESPDYFSYASEKRDTPLSLFKKVFYAIDVIVSEALFHQLMQIFNFEPLLKKHINQLEEADKIIFTLICDILIGKHVLLVPLTKLKMEISKKIEFFKLLNDITQNKSTIVIFSSWDILDAKIFATRVICLDEGKKVLDKSINDILKTYDSLDSFLLNYLQQLNSRKKQLDYDDENNDNFDDSY